MVSRLTLLPGVASPRLPLGRILLPRPPLEAGKLASNPLRKYDMIKIKKPPCGGSLFL